MKELQRKLTRAETELSKNVTLQDMQANRQLDETVEAQVCIGVTSP